MRMIPSFLDENSPPGERSLYNNLQRSTKNWVAIHSLDLAPYNRNRRTEIDFVLIIPEKGILCVEVKSQSNIVFDGHKWNPNTIKRSPFKQALDARYAFRRRLKTLDAGRFKHIPVVHICVFPESDFYVGSNISVANWEFLDRDSFMKSKGVNDFCDLISYYFTLSVENDPQLSKLEIPISEEMVTAIIDFCYPIRIRKPELAKEIEYRQKDLEKVLLNQQKPIFNLCALNNKILVEGGAGTGKSLIALEVAKRKSEEGLRVAYICYNRLIGKHSSNTLDNLQRPNLVVGSIYSILIQLLDITPPENASSEWWDCDALSLFEDKLTDPEFSLVTTFDYLVIDEAQDILARPRLWECVKLLMGDNYLNGKMLVLGDFVNQSLVENIDDMQKSYINLSAISTNWRLTDNCRNYREIGETALILSGLKRDTWTGFMRVGGSHNNWRFQPYSNSDEQLSEIKKYIQLAKNDGFKDRDITILTFCATEKSIIKRLVFEGFTLDKFNGDFSSCTSYSTINAFKGLENKVIIISDVVLSPQSAEKERKLFYTGITRATERLYILSKSTSLDILQKWFSEGMVR